MWTNLQLTFISNCLHCAVPDNIHTNAKDGHWKFRRGRGGGGGGGGGVISIAQENMKLNWKFQGMGGSKPKNLWPFSVCEKNWLVSCWAGGSNNFLHLLILLLFPEKHQSLDKHIMVSPCPVYLSRARKKIFFLCTLPFSNHEKCQIIKCFGP